jgi:S1-C subfamily serine protease
MPLIISTFLALFCSLSFAQNLMVDSLRHLSSDDFKGRRAGSPENKKATEYLKDQLKKMKLQGLAGTHSQEFTIFTRMLKNGVNSLRVAGQNESFEPVSFSQSGELENLPLVFVGYGISIPQSDPKLTYDDYAGVDVEGKIVVLMTGDPAIGNQQSLFRSPTYLNYRSLNYKLNNAANHKAAGVIVIQDPKSLDGASEPALFFNEREGGGKRFNTIAGFSTIEWFNRILKASKKPHLLQLQEGITATQIPRSFSLEQKASLSVHLKKETGRVENVFAFIPGTHESLKKDIIVVGAHFDHLGMGGQSSMESDRTPKIHNGADDNASGTAMLLEMARRLSKIGHKRSIAFVFFNAEEEGLLGSAHFVANWKHQYAETYGELYAMVNLDMVGRFQKKVSLMGTGSAFEWKDLLAPLTMTQQIPVESSKLAVASSDHASFIQKEVPALFLTTGAHEDYHRASDDFDKINLEAMNLLNHYVYQLIRQVSESETSLTFNPEAAAGDGGRDRGYGAHLGCIPKFGQNDDISGVVCTGTVPGSPANEAGVADMDVLVNIGEIEIKNIYDLAFALKFYRAGDLVELKWKRGEKVFSKTVKLTTKRRNDNKSNHHHRGCHHPPIM